MKINELLEKVNDKIFYTDFKKEKDILDGEYHLVATCGYVGYGSKPGFKSKQFRIVAKTKNGVEIGWVNFENKDDALEALDLSIQPAHRRKGIASQMYKFARELGNDIRPSSLQTSMGKLFWSKKNHAVDEGMMKRSDPYISGDKEGPVPPKPKTNKTTFDTKILNLAQKANVPPEKVEDIWHATKATVDMKMPNAYAIVTARVKKTLGI